MKINNNNASNYGVNLLNNFTNNLQAKISIKNVAIAILLLCALKITYNFLENKIIKTIKPETAPNIDLDKSESAVSLPLQSTDSTTQSLELFPNESKNNDSLKSDLSNSEQLENKDPISSSAVKELIPAGELALKDYDIDFIMTSLFNEIINDQPSEFKFILDPDLTPEETENYTSPILLKSGNERVPVFDIFREINWHSPANFWISNTKMNYDKYYHYVVTQSEDKV
jgi:hypothetical protein